MPDQNVHALALQLAQAAQKYEQYLTEIATLGQRYQGTPVWVESILGEMTPEIQQMFAEINEANEMYQHAVRHCRNTLLTISQKLMRLSGEM